MDRFQTRKGDKPQDTGLERPPSPNNSLKPTRRACGEVVASCPPVWVIHTSTWRRRRVGVRLVLIAGEG